MQACNYFPEGQNHAVLLGILPAVEWKPVRQALALARNNTADMTLQKLAEATGLDKSTIHRIENVKKYPDHVPELESVEKLAEALNLQLSLQISTRDISPLPTARHSDTKESLAPQGDKHGGPVSQALRLEELGATLLDAALALRESEAGRQNAVARAASPARPKSDRARR